MLPLVRTPVVLGLLLSLGTLAACDSGAREPFATGDRDGGLARRDSGAHPDAEGLDAELGVDVDQQACLEEYFECRAALVAAECSDAGEQSTACGRLRDRRCLALRCSDPACVGGCPEGECRLACDVALDDRMNACTAQCEPESEWPTPCTAECARVREEQITACDADPCTALRPIVHDPLPPPILDAGVDAGVDAG